jgi:hypothetical protein
MRPVHRPPRTPADRHPHCAWTVVIDESHPKAESIPAVQIVRETRAATWELEPIDRSEEGQADYSGALVSDFDFGAYSHSALVRTAEEVCLQMHLLNLAFGIAVRKRAADAELAISVNTRQLIGLAGLAAERIHRALQSPVGIDGALRVFELHPLLNPAGYVAAETESDRVIVHRSPAHDDGAWISLCTPESVRPLQAIAAAVDPRIQVRVSGTDTDWTAELAQTDTAAKELPEVSVAKFSRGSTFEFEPRRSLPLTVI